ncbi:MAG: hypothetical protein WBL35_15065 [Ornithinibacter sp.]
MTLGPEHALAQSLVARLDALGVLVARAEGDVLACLVVTGEPRPQRVLDDWLDQSADTLRAIGEAVSDLSPRLSRWTGSPDASSRSTAPRDEADAAHTTPPPDAPVEADR